MENKILIGGDYSGIQGYIYNITSKYASRNLKGRSNCLKKDCEATAYRIRDIVNGEVIVSSGGTFLILADDSEVNISNLKKAIAQEEQSVYDTYGTDIYVAIDYVHLNEVTSYQEAATKLFLKRDAKKNRKLSALINNDYDAFFEPQQWYYDKTDAITGAYFKSEKEMCKCEGIDGFVTEQTLNQIEEGDRLASENGRLRDFNNLVDKEADLVRLGVLRMDVDNLGTTFQDEIRKCTSNLHGYSKLSQQFTDFFEEKNLYSFVGKDCSVFIVYSGGDDIFAVGQWDHALDFAEQVRKRFGEQSFVKDRNLSISGGVAILPYKYPIMKGAVEGGELEDLAKNHIVGKNEKDSIAFLGMALNWELEYPVVKKLKDKIVGLTKAEALDSSFRSKILLHHANAGVKGHKISNVKTYWMLTYDLGRLKQRNAKNADVVSMIENCMKEVCNNAKYLDGNAITTDYHSLELWALACRWAELEIRTKAEIEIRTKNI